MIVAGNGSSARFGSNVTQDSTVNGALTNITTATAFPITIRGNNDTAQIGGINVHNSIVNGAVTNITTATASPITIVGHGNTGGLGGTNVQGSTVKAAITSITTATASPISIMGNNTAKIGGLSVQNSTMNTLTTDITTAAASPITVIDNSNKAAIGGAEAAVIIYRLGVCKVRRPIPEITWEWGVLSWAGPRQARASQMLVPLGGLEVDANWRHLPNAPVLPIRKADLEGILHFRGGVPLVSPLADKKEKFYAIRYIYS